MQYRLLGKMASFWEAFSGKRFVCCALTVLYSIYNMVGRSIAFYSTSVNMSPRVAYISCRPPYRTIYITNEAMFCHIYVMITLITHTYPCTHAHTCIHTHTHAHTRTHSCTHAHTLMHTHSCTHAHNAVVLTTLPYVGIQPSLVHGFIQDGLFTGVVHAGSDTYHLEPLGRHLAGTDSTFHSIVYRASDMRYHAPGRLGVSHWDCAACEHAHRSGGSPKSGAFPAYHLSGREVRSVHSLTR